MGAASQWHLPKSLIAALDSEEPASEALRPRGAGPFYSAEAGTHSTTISSKMLAQRRQAQQAQWLDEELETQLCKSFDKAHPLYTNEDGYAFLTKVKYRVKKVEFLKYTCNLCCHKEGGQIEVMNSHLDGKKHKVKFQSESDRRKLSRAIDADTCEGTPGLRAPPGVFGTCGTPGPRAPPGLTSPGGTGKHSACPISNRRLRPADLQRMKALRAASEAAQAVVAEWLIKASQNVAQIAVENCKCNLLNCCASTK